MKTTLSSTSQVERYNASAPALALFLLVAALRSLDIIVPGLGALPDKSILSRVLGFIFVMGYLWALRRPIRSIGFHARDFDKAFLIGGLSLVLLYAALYAVQFYRLSIAGEIPRLVFGAINHETAAMGGLYFTLFYLSGQIVNAFMEESIFRGLMLPHLMQRFRFWQANVLQAFLFGLAHLVWPVVSWIRGQSTAGEALTGAPSLLLFTTVGGLIFGYLYYRTGSLWTAVFVHLIDNGVARLFHIQIAGRLNAETDILMLASIGLISLTILAWAVAKRSDIPALKPWEPV